MQRLRWCLVFMAVLVLAGCGDGNGNDPGDGAAATVTLEISALAGPTCPVETDPPSPDCAPLPVANAVIVVTDADGTEVARGTTASDGTVTIDVVPGELMVVPQPVDGILGTAPPIAITAVDNETVQLTADYDTGIR